MTIQSAVVSNDRRTNEEPRYAGPAVRKTGYQTMLERQEAKAAQFARERRAKELPDSLFANNPEVQRLQTLVTQRENRVRLMNDGQQVLLIRGRIEALRAKLQQKQDEIEGAALDDAFDESQAYERSYALSEDIRRLELSIKSAELAHKVLTTNTMAPRQSELLRAERNQLASLLKMLKLEHLDGENGVTP